MVHSFSTGQSAGLVVAGGLNERSAKLKAADATHLATAVSAGADRFITNNQRDFTKDITEVDITYPADLTDPGA